MEGGVLEEGTEETGQPVDPPAAHRPSEAPHPLLCPRNVSSAPRPHSGNCSRSQPRDCKVLLRLSGWDLCLNAVRAST